QRCLRHRPARLRAAHDGDGHRFARRRDHVGPAREDTPPRADAWRRPGPGSRRGFPGPGRVWGCPRPAGWPVAGGGRLLHDHHDGPRQHHRPDGGHRRVAGPRDECLHDRLRRQRTVRGTPRGLDRRPLLRNGLGDGRGHRDGLRSDRPDSSRCSARPPDLSRGRAHWHLCRQVARQRARGRSRPRQGRRRL
ncbi:MAG: hypothetical protein AVDCRST_MAG70-229, partial [uncultured Thermomicrobiales bacterium]